MSASKDKGTAWESAIVAYLVDNGWLHVERRALRGTKDQGDISGLPGLVIEAKNERAVELGQYMNEVEAECRNAKANVGAAWLHRRGRSSPAHGYVVMTGKSFIYLLKAAGW